MFYVKSVNTKGVVTICDTRTNTDEAYLLQDLIDIIEKNVLGCRIYGAYVWEHECFCSHLEINQKFDLKFFNKLCEDFHKNYTVYMEHKIEDYLAMLQNGTSFNIVYGEDTDKVEFLKTDEDVWSINSKYFGRRTVSSIKAESILDMSLTGEWKIES